MAHKQNPLLSKYEALLEAKYQAQLNLNTEIDIIVHLISCNEDLQVGPGRAERVLNGFLETKMSVVNSILSDSADDPDLWKTKHDLALQLKQILGPENWQKYRALFTLLKDYWDV